MVGGALLAISVFLPWYETGNSNSTIASDKGAQPLMSAWNALPVWRFLLLLAAVAPFILAWIIVREHALSWPRGELTAVVGLAALTLILVKRLHRQARRAHRADLALLRLVPRAHRARS